MRPYRTLGVIPPKRHMQFRPQGNLVYEELFGRIGFSGPSSLLYHAHLPESTNRITPGNEDLSPPVWEQVHQQAHLKGMELSMGGTVIEHRTWLLANDDVRIGIAVPDAQQTALYVNGSADEVLFFHKGSGILHSQFGRVPIREHDYCVIPRGTIYRLELDLASHPRILCLEVTGLVESPSRYRAYNGQLTEIAPYSERDVRGPEELEQEEGAAELLVKRSQRFSTYELDNHPFDIIGWDGTVYPYCFNIHDFEPRAGRFHVPPPIHQTFEAPNLVICSFVPRKLDWDPEALFLPYHHSNLDSDEVLYYVDGNYQARRGIHQGSFTHHVGGLPHGPQPGAVEASLSREPVTDELAVMIDTFRPLWRTQAALDIADPTYPFSWHSADQGGSTSIP